MGKSGSGIRSGKIQIRDPEWKNPDLGSRMEKSRSVIRNGKIQILDPEWKNPDPGPGWKTPYPEWKNPDPSFQNGKNTDPGSGMEKSISVTRDGIIMIRGSGLEKSRSWIQDNSPGSAALRRC
jgi:hypothetical protein